MAEIIHLTNHFRWKLIIYLSGKNDAPLSMIHSSLMFYLFNKDHVIEEIKIQFSDSSYSVGKT